MAGRLFCPGCFCMQEFAAERDAPISDIECVVCGYAFEPARIELPSGETERRPVIPTSVLLEARDAAMMKFRDDVIANGYRRENFTHERRKS